MSSSSPAAPPAVAPAPLAVKLGALAVVFVFVLGLACAAEWFVRRRAEAKYGFANADHLACQNAEIGTLTLCPNLSLPHLASNALGFRGGPIADPKPAGTVRLAFLGGSTTLALEASGDAKTWVERTGAMLRARYPDARFDVVNGGVAGHTLADMHKNWRRVAPLRPDVVVLYEGTNDLTQDTRRLAKAEGLISSDPARPSWLAERSMLYGLVEKNVRILLRSQSGDANTPTLRYDADQVSQGFKQRYAALVADVKAAGVPLVVLVTFAPRIRRDQPPEVQQAAMVTTRYYAPFLDVAGALDGFDAYNRRVRELAAESGALLVDDIAHVPGDGVHYTDSVHMSDAGLEKQAERVVAALVEAPAFRALVATSTAAAR
jgi:lysophospholipase L1-like esterase